MSQGKSKIGVFDSGFGGLTVFKSIQELLPDYEYIYLGDNARAPYGSKSLDLIYEYTKASVIWLFEQGCELVILACNTASAKALRKLQQEWLRYHYPEKRILGVIRPTAEVVDQLQDNNVLGILGTKGTVYSGTYLEEIKVLHPEVEVFQQACPMWVPFIEDGLIHREEFKTIVKRDVNALLAQNENIKSVLLACTHYPIIIDILEEIADKDIKFISQGPIIAESLKQYLSRHQALEEKIAKSGKQYFYTTDDTENFDVQASRFFGKEIKSEKVRIG